MLEALKMERQSEGIYYRYIYQEKKLWYPKLDIIKCQNFAQKQMYFNKKEEYADVIHNIYFL